MAQSIQDLQAFTAAQLITMACHGVLNTQFVAPNPKPSWFDDLNAKLADAKTVANEWVNTLGPKVSSSIPLQVINFGSTYNAVSENIQSIVKDHPTAKGQDNEYVLEIKTMIQDGLISGVNDVLTNVDSASKDLEAWGKKLQAAHDALASGATNIQNLEISLKSEIDSMNNAIANLHQVIDGENKAIAASAAAIAVGVFALVVGIALAPETGGASLYVGGAIAAAGIIGGAVTWGVMQHRIDEQFKEIAKDQQQIAADKRQIIALQGLSSASDGAVANLALASSSLSKFRTQWAVFQGELSDVLQKLEKAEGELSVIMQGVFTEAAQNEWQKATDTANALANRKIQIEVKTLPMQSVAVAAA